MISFLGLFAALAVLVVLTMRGVSLFLATPVCALLITLTSGIALLPALTDSGSALTSLYVAGFSGFIESWFLMFLLGSMFGKMMEDSGAADRIAH